MDMSDKKRTLINAENKLLLLDLEHRLDELQKYMKTPHYRELPRAVRTVLHGGLNDLKDNIKKVSNLLYEEGVFIYDCKERN